jgi:hypothetical protein
MRFVLLTVLLLLAAPAGSVAAAQPVARVASTEGIVLLVRDGSRAPLGAAEPLFLDDEVRTGHNGRLVVEGDGGLTLVIGPASEVKLRRWLTRPQGGRVDAVLTMLTGVMRLFTTGSGERSIDVETRAAVASVRSTEWLVEATAASTGVFSIAGVVEVVAAGTTVRLTPGLGTDAVLGGPPAAPAAWAAPRLARVEAAAPRP